MEQYRTYFNRVLYYQKLRKTKSWRHFWYFKFHSISFLPCRDLFTYKPIYKETDETYNRVSSKQFFRVCYLLYFILHFSWVTFTADNNQLNWSLARVTKHVISLISMLYRLLSFSSDNVCIYLLVVTFHHHSYGVTFKFWINVTQLIHQFT